MKRKQMMAAFLTTSIIMFQYILISMFLGDSLSLQWVSLYYINQSNRKMFLCGLGLFFFLHINGSVHKLAPPQELAAGLILDVFGIRFVVAALFGRGGIHKLPRSIGGT
mmetsp:Transcript_12785/g.36487  ORF Transcript_12785/g.36487 Transcript_12785/m.36487 type:complete len:109 (-) Transcript_12785:1068-1394(-)